MVENKKQGLFDIGITTLKVLLLVLFVFVTFVLVFYGLINRGDVIKSEPVEFIKNLNVLIDEKGDQIITATLPSDVDNNEYLFFDTRKDAAVYINGELRKDFIEKRDVNLPGGLFRRFLMEVPLKETDAGTEVKIVRYSVEKIDKDAPEIFYGTRSGALSYLFDTIGLLFILSFIVLIFSFVSFVVSIVLRVMYKQRIDMTYGALGICTIAAWIISDSFLFPFVFGVYHVNGLLSFMLCLMIPLPLIIYLSSIQKGRNRKIMSVVIFVSIINATVWPFLHFLKIVPFYNDIVIDLANGILLFLAVTGIAILIADAIKGNIDSYRYTFIGFIGFLVGCMIELTNIFLGVEFVRESIPMVIGLGFLLTFIVIQQVSDLGKINSEKQHAIDISEAKTRFLASMSHEIRTPINSILGMNEMILRENNDKAIDEYSRNIKTSGKMLLMLVNDVLDFTKIESGKMEIKEADFLMSEMLYDVISLIKERAEEKKLSLNVEIIDKVPEELISDEFRIRQILVNLLNNAVKYTEKGKVTLKVGGNYTDDGYNLQLLVKDTGKGIHKEDQEHLFEAFSRADLKTNASIEGTGLGLAIVKSIVDSMNGEYGIESEYGSGSEFWVKLPVKYSGEKLLRDDFMEHRTSQASAAKTGSFTAPEAKILAVDDNQSNLTIVKLFLKKNGIVPDLCSTGNRAIELCREKKYDLILLDHMMPEPDGIETLHIIRKDEASLNKDTKAIVLTANAVAGSRQLYMSEGFDDYLTKPLDSNLLEETVKKMLPEDLIIVSSVSDDDSTDNDKEKTKKSDIKELDDSITNTDQENDDKTSITGTGSFSSEQDRAESLKNRLSEIEELDYDVALTYCGGEEELLREIIGDIVSECSVRADRMKKSLLEKDIKAYQIDAHTIKSTMLTIGLKNFSERAKKHEFAAKENNTEFIYEDAEEFLNGYEGLCKKLGEICSEEE